MVWGDHTIGKSSTGSDTWLRASGIPTPSLHVKVDPPPDPGQGYTMGVWGLSLNQVIWGRVDLGEVRGIGTRDAGNRGSGPASGGPQ